MSLNKHKTTEIKIKRSSTVQLTEIKWKIMKKKKIVQISNQYEHEILTDTRIRVEYY